MQLASKKTRIPAVAWVGRLYRLHPKVSAISNSKIKTGIRCGNSAHVVDSCKQQHSKSRPNCCTRHMVTFDSL